MSIEVDDAVRFSIEDIKDSLDTLEDHDYCEALLVLSGWCMEEAKKKVIAQAAAAAGYG